MLHEFLGDQDIEARDATGLLSTTYENEGTWYDIGLGFSHQSARAPICISIWKNPSAMTTKTRISQLRYELEGLRSSDGAADVSMMIVAAERRDKTDFDMIR